MLASPHATLERGGDATTTTGPSSRPRREVGATRIVVGLPRSLSGELGPGGAGRCWPRSRRCEVGARADGIEVETYDERFTTVIAQRNLRDATPRREASTAPSATHRRLGRGGDPPVVARRSASDDGDADRRRRPRRTVASPAREPIDC